LDHCDLDGWTALRYSSWIGNAKIVKKLLESGASVDACDSDGRTALRAAVFGNHENIVKLLIKYGADGKFLYSYSIPNNL
jgi:ankyrin repeat domain-containing protein 50